LRGELRAGGGGGRLGSGTSPSVVTRVGRPTGRNGCSWGVTPIRRPGTWGGLRRSGVGLDGGHGRRAVDDHGRKKAGPGVSKCRCSRRTHRPRKQAGEGTIPGESCSGGVGADPPQPSGTVGRHRGARGNPVGNQRRNNGRPATSLLLRPRAWGGRGSIGRGTRARCRGGFGGPGRAAAIRPRAITSAGGPGTERASPDGGQPATLGGRTGGPRQGNH